MSGTPVNGSDRPSSTPKPKPPGNSNSGNNNLNGIADLLGSVGLGIDLFNTSTGNYSGGGLEDFQSQIDELKDQIEQSIAVLDDRRDDRRDEIDEVFDLNENYIGPTKDAVEEYKAYFGSIADGLRDNYTGVLRNERPDLSEYTARLNNTISDSRQNLGLMNSPAMDLYQKVIDVDQTRVFPDAIDFSAETGYNQANPLITYMDDPDARALMSYGNQQLDQYKKTMTDGRGAGQTLMNYGV